jgi:hypothetical protein
METPVGYPMTQGLILFPLWYPRSIFIRKLNRSVPTLVAYVDYGERRCADAEHPKRAGTLRLEPGNADICYVKEESENTRTSRTS